MVRLLLLFFTLRKKLNQKLDDGSLVLLTFPLSYFFYFRNTNMTFIIIFNSKMYTWHPCHLSNMTHRL